MRVQSPLFKLLIHRFSTTNCSRSLAQTLLRKPAQLASFSYLQANSNGLLGPPKICRSWSKLKNQKTYLSSDSSATMTEIKFDEVKKALEDKTLTFVDVREKKELIQDGKIPGSINVPLGEFDLALTLTPEKFLSTYGGSIPTAEDSDKLILSCRSGRRAISAVEIAKKHGYDKVLWYSGSFLDWEAKGGPLEKP